MLGRFAAGQMQDPGFRLGTNDRGLGPVVLIFQSDLHPGCQGSVDALIHTGATDPELMADGGNWTTVCILKQQLGALNLPDRSGPGATQLFELSLLLFGQTQGSSPTVSGHR
jgi:hypothetical protein